MKNAPAPKSWLVQSAFAWDPTIIIIIITTYWKSIC